MTKLRKEPTMLLVTISNIDDTYHGVFDTDDKKTAAEAALADLIANDGFFPENRVSDLPDSFRTDLRFRHEPDVYGILGRNSSSVPDGNAEVANEPRVSGAHKAIPCKYSPSSRNKF